VTLATGGRKRQLRRSVLGTQRRGPCGRWTFTSGTGKTKSHKNGVAERRTEGRGGAKWSKKKKKEREELEQEKDKGGTAARNARGVATPGGGGRGGCGRREGGN